MGIRVSPPLAVVNGSCDHPSHVLVNCLASVADQDVFSDLCLCPYNVVSSLPSKQSSGKADLVLSY